MPVSLILIISFLFSGLAQASEVIVETNSKVIIREHPKTGKPYVVITSQDFPAESGFFGISKKFSRPDYRLLDPKVKSGEIPYDGPYSDAKRVYIFAATLATLGAGGLVGAALMPASAGAAASGGAGYLAAGGALAAGTAGAAVATTQSNPKKDNFIQASESKSIIKEQP